MRYKPRRPVDPAVRFWNKVDKTETCWLWTGSRLPTRWPYGRFGLTAGILVGAHRFSWEAHFGPIPRGMWVLHHCDNPPCVRPDHLFLGDALDNMRNMIAKGRQHLPAHSATTSQKGATHHLKRHPELIQRGEAASRSKLTDGLVQYVRAECAKGRTQKDVAREIGMSPMAISRIVRRVSWSHI